MLSDEYAELQPTCLRFATVYGVAPRMRFDLTVNEFTRDLWADRELEVFGEQFWRPYIHVADAARAVRTVLEAPREQTASEVFNAGRSGENYTKQMLVEEIQRAGRPRQGLVREARRGPARLQGLASTRSARCSASRPSTPCPTASREIAQALDEDRWPDPWGARYRNIP